MHRYILLAAGVLLSLLLFACSGAEDGDLTPPNFTFDGGIPSRTQISGPWLFSGTADLDAEIDVTIVAPLIAPFPTLSTSTPDILPNGPNGIWSFEVNLVEGINQFGIDVVDPVGNSTVYYVTIVLDLTGPVVTLDQYTNFTPSLTQTLAGTVAEVDAQRVQISIDGGSTWPYSTDDLNGDFNGGIWSYELTFPTDATTYDVRVRATDALGNVPSDPDDALVMQQNIEVNSTTAPNLTVTQGLPFYVSDPATTFSVDLDGTYDSANYSLTFSTNTITTLTPDTTSIPDVWSLNVDNLPAGLTVVTLKVEDSVPAEVAQAKMMIVRDQGSPVIIDSVPAHGEKNVDPSTNIVVTFSETMKPLTVTNEMVVLTDEAGAPVPFTLNPPVAAAQDREFTFTPDVALANDTQYSLSFVNPEAQAVTDFFGNAFAAPATVLTFKTAP